MAQITSGFRKILEIPSIYTFLQDALGAKRSRKMIVENALKLKGGDRILDVGCGPGDIVPFLPNDIYYLGFDFEESYINKAKNKYGSRGTFVCEDVTKFNFEGEKFDRIVITGVLHHLENDEIQNLFSKLCKLLKPTGFLFAVENVYIDHQNRLARYLISRDRGQNVRTIDGYLNLCFPYFSKVSYEIKHDLLRVPYTHIFIKCQHG